MMAKIKFSACEVMQIMSYTDEAFCISKILREVGRIAFVRRVQT